MWAPCRVTADPRPMLHSGGLNANSLVSDIPYIGEHYIGRLQRRGYVWVQDLVNYFQGLSAANIHRRLSELFRNPRRQTCDRDRQGKRYHVSDVNQCAFNSVLLVLQHFNVVGAANIPLRDRGNSREARDCACHSSRNQCLEFGCRWRSEVQTRLPGGRCIPPADGCHDGFSGHGIADRYDQNTERIPRRNQVTVVNGNGGPHYYVQRWRVLPGEVIPVRRSTRRDTRATTRATTTRGRRRTRGGPPRLLACGTNVPTNVSPRVTYPNPEWSDESSRMWANAVVDRFL